MAKLSVNICDLCKKMSNEDFSYALAIGKSGKTLKDIRRGDICNDCYDDLIKRLESSFDINKNTQDKVEAKLVPSAGRTPIAGKNTYVEPECTHDRNYFDGDKNLVICRDCGHTSKA